MQLEEKLTANFCCAKCHGKTAVTKTVSLGRGLPELLTLSPGKYILLTCGLCGYTEIYDPTARMLDEASETASKSMPQET